MSSKLRIVSRGAAYAIFMAGIVAGATMTNPKSSLGQTATPGGTTAIQRGSESARSLNLPEPSFQTREERLNAKPLDWNSTTGTPKPRTLTTEERNALQHARPQSSAGGRPNARANEEARRLHPDDWK
jgi:hypothetical protein